MMFTTKTPSGTKRVKTLNIIVGCQHDCTYCYAQDLALGMLSFLPQYRGFKPNLVPEASRKRFKGGVVFVSSMGDMFGDWVPREWIEYSINCIKCSPNATFLLLTKNPWRYHEFLSSFPQNVILGATIESDIDHGVSKAPPPLQRAEAMASIHWLRKFVAIEPIMDFDIDAFPELLRQIGPEFVYLGLDNHSKKLPEPPLAKTRELISILEQFTEVRPKTIREAWDARR